MVLESLAALSLATSIIQIVDFSSKIVGKSRDIYSSADGATIGHEDLASAATRLKDLNQTLNTAAPTSNDATNASSAEHTLSELTTRASAIADELLILLEALKVPGSTNHRWKSFRQALKSAFKQGQVDKINERLQAVRQELNFTLLVSFR